MARGGGGVLLPFVPGQTTAEAVYAVLGATYGTTLREATVELPAGLTEVAPTKLDTIVSGGEEMSSRAWIAPTWTDRRGARQAGQGKLGAEVPGEARGQ